MHAAYTRSARVRAFGIAAWLTLATSGCVYYNGVYNARAAARDGDRRLARGGETEATPFFQSSAAKAESILVRHPKSSWRTHALYLAGRGAALAGQCETGVPRLSEFLAEPGTTAADRDRARVALGVCDLRLTRIPAARARLDSLIDAPDAQTARQARIWAARAALAAGDRDAVARYLGDADDGALPWELLLSSLAAREYTRVESLLVQRAALVDYRDDVPRALREMWAAGEWDGVERVVQRFDAVRLRDAQRATLHFAVGELNLRSGRDSIARQHLFTARTLAGRDSIVERESAARLAFITMVRAASLPDVDSVLVRLDSATLRTPFARRVSEQLLLIRLLTSQDEPTGAARFLAAEVARDSLRAVALARSLFMQVVREQPGAALAPHALYAAGLLTPDSAAAWGQRIAREYSGSAVARWIAGDDPASQSDFASVPALLSQRWGVAIRVWADSVRKLRTPARANGTPSGPR